MSIIVSGVTHHYQNDSPLFPPISFTVSDGQKASLIGNNGSGKSTLLRIIAGEIQPAEGSVSCGGNLYYVPQLSSSDIPTLADALGIKAKLVALHAILEGKTDEKYYEALGDDWSIEEECHKALASWGLADMSLDTPFGQLSGGEKTKILLAGIALHHPDTVLLDEPTNHLDTTARQKLYQWVEETKSTLLVVSHDETLLNLMDTTLELSPKGLRVFGGNYDDFESQKESEAATLQQQIDSGWAALRAAKRKAQKVRERQEQRAAQGKRNSQKGGQARILLHAKGSKAQATEAKLNGRHQDKMNDAWQHLQDLKARQQVSAQLKVDISDSQLHLGKSLVKAENVNFCYDKEKPLWAQDINLELQSGDRWWVTGDNGSGKTTLLRLMLGQLEPTSGTLHRNAFTFDYMDQEYRQVRQPLTVKNLAMSYNCRHLPEHEVCLMLNRALFPQVSWEKLCTTLSGGERMRLYLCCMMIADQAPDLFVLDEPTNNLDLQSKKVLADTLRNYRGTLLVVSHDERFIEYIGINHRLNLS